MDVDNTVFQEPNFLYPDDDHVAGTTDFLVDFGPLLGANEIVEDENITAGGNVG